MDFFLLVDSPWHSCWWIYEKEQRLGQQSLGWALSHIYCANWKAGQTVGHDDAEPLLPLCGGEICRARFLAAYRACFSTSEGELCVRQGGNTFASHACCCAQLGWAALNSAAAETGEESPAGCKLSACSPGSGLCSGAALNCYRA